MLAEQIQFKCNHLYLVVIEGFFFEPDDALWVDFFSDDGNDVGLCNDFLFRANMFHEPIFQVLQTRRCLK